jgi:hypothetical protein
MDVTRLYDWNLMQDLKHQYCTFHIVRAVNDEHKRERADLCDLTGYIWSKAIRGHCS